MPAFKIEAVAKPSKETISLPVVAEPDGFVPLSVLQNSVRFWWILTVLVVAGGLAGWLIHRLNPPIYEASGQFSASIDFVLTGPLTQFEEDVALNAIGDLMITGPVLQAVVDGAGTEGISTNPTDLMRMVTLERRVNTWVLRIRHADPEVASRIGNIWIEQGQSILLESYRHALLASQLNRYIRSLENCLSMASASEPSHPQCNHSQFAEIQANLQEAGDALYKERAASHGLFAGLAIGPAAPAVLAEKPVQYGRNQLVLAGSLIGLLLGLWIIQLGIPGRWIKRN